MAPVVGFWRFMDDVHDMTFPMACIDWRKTPVIDEVIPTVNRVQKDATRPAEVPSLGKGDLVEEETPAKVNTHQLIEDLNKQNKELSQERSNAIKWQDAASMAIKEANDEAETRKQETKAAKKAGFQAVAMVQRQLIVSRDQVAALKRDKARAGVEKNRAEVEHRKEISVAEGRIRESQTGLISAISHGRESIELFEELSRMSQDMQNELVAKDQQLTAKEGENKELQDRINARSSVFEDISEEARKDREACEKSQREKLKSEKAQRVAERRVNGLQREAITVKATTDRAMKALQTKLAESVARETGASTRAIKAEGDAEKFRRELDNTESARQMFEKREGEWAALFAANQTHAGTSTQSTRNAAVAQESETNSQIATSTTDRVEVSKLTKVSSKKKNKTEEWKRDVRRELEEQNQTVFATERENIRRELDEEKRIALVAERQAIRGIVKSSLKAKLVMRLKSQKNKELRKVRRRATAERVRGKKGQVKWDFVKAVSPPVEVDRSQLETQIRSQLQNEFQNELANQKTQWENEKTAEQSQLETRIRSQLQTELQNDLASHRSRWETEHAAVERPRLETQIRTQLETEFQTHKTQWQIQYVDIERSQLENQIRGQLQDEYEDELSQFKTQWEVEHSPSQAAVEAHNNEVSENQIEVDESGGAGAVTARSAEDDMVLASLSRESDETHELLQEIGRIGIPRDSVAYTVLQGLNKAKDALYDIKCELRKPDAIVNKNNLLHSVKGVHINKHYIQKLSLNTREVLIRQANEANTRLEYVKNTLGTNGDVPKDVVLKSLLEPLQTETEPEHMDVSAPPQMANGIGDAAAVGASTYPQTVNEAGNPAAPGTSTLTTVDGNASPATHGTSMFPVTVSSFVDMAIPSISETDHSPSSSSSSSTDPKALNGFGDTTAPGLNKTSTESVFNPFENSHFGNQPSLDSMPCQNDQDSGRSDRKTETDRNSNSNFKKTFRPLLPQGEGPAAPPVNVNATASPEPSFNFGNLSSTTPEVSSDKDHQMDTDDGQPPLTATRDHGGVASGGFVPSRQRQAKNSQAQQRVSAPKGRQLVHKAFAKKQNALASMPAQTQQVDPQDQVPATQQFGSFEFPRTAFTLDPNHAFGE